MGEIYREDHPIQLSRVYERGGLMVSEGLILGAGDGVSVLNALTLKGQAELG